MKQKKKQNLKAIKIVSLKIYFTITIALLLLVIGYLIYLLINANKQRVIFEKEKLLFDSKVKCLQLETLESRLDPHLFKNILNSIQSHAYQTYYALDKMAGVLDYILYDSQKKLVSLQEEHQFSLRLIDINKIKLSPLFELRVKSVIDDESLYNQQLIAPLLCVELIENAFKHADLQSRDSFISILFEIKKGTFNLLVTNKISGKTTLKKEHSGFGLDALSKRLELIYGPYFKLERFINEDVFSMHLKIHLNDFKAKMHTLG